MQIPTFMLAVLASNLFWVGYVIASMIGALLVMRIRTPHVLALMTKSKEDAKPILRKAANDAGWACVSTLAIHTPEAAYPFSVLILIIWPLWLSVEIGIIVVRNLLKLSAGALKLIFTTLDKLVPTVSVKVKEKES